MSISSAAAEDESCLKKLSLALGKRVKKIRIFICAHLGCCGNSEWMFYDKLLRLVLILFHNLINLETFQGQLDLFKSLTQVHFCNEMFNNPFYRLNNYGDWM